MAPLNKNTFDSQDTLFMQRIEHWLEEVLLVHGEPHRFLDRALSGVRWGTLAALLLLALVQPGVPAWGIPTWALVLAFAAYSLAFNLLRRRVPQSLPLTIHALMDVPVALVIYFLGAEPGGPLFVLFFLGVDYAAASMTIRGTLVYSMVVAVLVAGVDLVFLFWMPTASDVQMLGARSIILVLVGVGMGIVSRRLIMQQKLAESAHNEATRMTQLQEVRGNFISSISHELRTPLTAARAGLGMIEMSVNDRLRPEEQRLMSTARRNVELLEILINDLLAYNQLEAGTLRLEREPLDLSRVITNSVSAVYPLVLEKGQTLKTALPERLAYTGDARQLEQVFVNLLANAQRHTPPGTQILIAVKSTADEIEITVSDTGPGIPNQELEKIFQRFYRSHPGDEGSGLGLAIAKGIVELHHGRIWAESQPDKGAAFHIALPLANEIGAG